MNTRSVTSSTGRKAWAANQRWVVGAIVRAEVLRSENILFGIKIEEGGRLMFGLCEVSPELIQGPGVLPNRGTSLYIREIRKIGL